MSIDCIETLVKKKNPELLSVEFNKLHFLVGNGDLKSSDHPPASVGVFIHTPLPCHIPSLFIPIARHF